MKSIKRFFLSGLMLAALTAEANAQWPGVYLQPVTITGMPGLQSFVYGTHNGRWVLLGGRTDGLHRRQPTASFADAGNNKQIYVVDPATGSVWSKPLSSLPVPMQEQLSSTNMQFHQRDSILYCVGGYGYSATAADHITYPYITAVNVAGLIDAVIAGSPITGYFRQQTAPEYAVTGGHLDMIYDVFYLVGGNKFTGRYNPMGGGSYVQEYTNQIRKMTIADDGTTMTVTHLPAVTDATNLHRRDYNLVPQILPDGKEGLTMFSGVFQLTADLPYLSCVNIDSSSHNVPSGFSQYYSHYHGANLPAYSTAANEMHSLFFGGIAQYYDNAGLLVRDDNVPFVKTISRVVRNSAGVMTEYKLPVDMPGLLGASAELIPATGVPMFPNHVVDLDAITADTTLAGYIVGGINSTAPNIFTINTGVESSASTVVYKVFLVRGSGVGTDKANVQSTNGLALQAFPNPHEGSISVMFELSAVSDVTLTVSDMYGRIVMEETISGMAVGRHKRQLHLGNREKGSVYMLNVSTSTESSNLKLITGRR